LGDLFGFATGILGGDDRKLCFFLHKIRGEFVVDWWFLCAFCWWETTGFGARRIMSRREEWQKVLDAEVARWSRMSWEELTTELREVEAYQVEMESKQYQVEVQLLENTGDYVHVSVSVDDGSLPQSIVPLTRSFIKQKSAASSG
jgi:hypothetical protein